MLKGSGCGIESLMNASGCYHKRVRESGRPNACIRQMQAEVRGAKPAGMNAFLPHSNLKKTVWLPIAKRVPSLPAELVCKTGRLENLQVNEREQFLQIRSSPRS